MSAPTPQTGDLWLPSELVSQCRLPHVCVRHGRPALHMRPVHVVSRTPAWALVLLLAGVLPLLLVALALRVTVRGYWPMCTRCHLLRARRRRAMWACLGGTVPVVLLSALAHSPLPLLVLPLLLVAGLFFLDLSGWPRLTRARVDRRTGTVHVRTPSPAFVAALPPPQPAEPAEPTQPTEPTHAGELAA